MSDLIDALKGKFGPQAVLTGEEIGDRYCSDWSGMPAQKPRAVLRPSSTEEVAAMLAACNDSGQPVVTQGGMTGMAGGAVPAEEEVSLSMERMSGIEELDSESLTVTLLAGTPLETVQSVAREAGLYLPLDLGARGSCTVGGNVATNAGGNQVIRYGMTRELVLGLEVVLADGRVISSLGKVLKNNTGCDLKHLFIGSEGTLGVVTRVVLRLQPLMLGTYTALCAAADFSDVVAFLKHAQAASGGGVSAFEVMWSDYYQCVVEHVESLQNPFEQAYPLYVLIEFQGANSSAIQESFEGMLFSALESGMLQNAVLAQSLKESESFWQIRDGIGEIVPLIEPVVAFDISVPVSTMKLFLQQIEQMMKQSFPDAKLYNFGHIGDGNLHVTVSMSDKDHRDEVCKIVYQAVNEQQGSISAEHGIGTLKKKYLPLSRSPEELELMEQLKYLLDPNQILNRGRIL